MKEKFHIGFMIGGKQRAGPAPGCSSLHIPDFTEKRRELVVIDAPGHQHLGVVVVECPQLRQAAQETGEMLGVLRLMDLAQLLQHVKQRFLKLLYGLSVLYVLSVCFEV